MTRTSLLLRNLRYFRGVNLAVIIGMAVATAVLTGALMVGDSVRGSLRELAIQRLGKVDDALVGVRFFDESLAGSVAHDTGFEVAPALTVRGGASSDAHGTRTADVQVAAVGGERAWDADVTPPRGSAVINGELADALGVKAPGETIVLSLPTSTDTPRDATLSRRARGDTLNGLRVDVAKIVRDPSFASLFNPNGGQRVPRNAWVNLTDLQEAVEQPQRVNALLASENAKASDHGVDRLNEAVARVAVLEDYGITRKPVLDGKVLAIGSRTTYLPPQVVEAANRAATKSGATVQKISVNLLNSLTAASGAAGPLHYVIAAGISPLDGQELGAAEAAINQWTADQLGVKVGDSLTIDFRVREAGGNLVDAVGRFSKQDLTFRVARVLPMSGIGADPSLPPDYKGLTDSSSVAEWNPPEGLDIDKKLVTKADEDYWNRWHAAPKLFVRFETAEKLWGGVYGGVTGLRVPADKSNAFLKALRDELPPGALGLTFRGIKSEQLSAASGGTDFSEYFVYFSFFLIVAAVLLVAMLFRLNIEQRARQLGLMSAVGFAPRGLRRLALGEGMILAIVGGVIGLAGAVGYTAFIMKGLRTWWVGAVGTTAMHLYVVPLTLIYGLVGSVVVAFFAILWGVWRVGRAPAAQLLAGSWESGFRRRRSGSWTRLIGLVGIVLGLVTLAMPLMVHVPTDEIFLSGSGLLLCSCLIWLGGSLRPRAHREVGFIGAASVIRLGVRNTVRHTARSVLAIGLIAFAVFALIVVAVMRQGGPGDVSQKSSGAGGYRLVVQAGIPLLGNLNTPAGRKLLGIRNPADPIWSSATFTPMRSWAGQDISCLNLTKPTSPTILSVPPQMVDRNAFSVVSSIRHESNPWTLLDPQDADTIPVITDDETAQYILKLPLGSTLPMTDQLGRTRQLKLVATLSGSIFQGALLMGDRNFLNLFPAQSGFGVVLVDCPADQQADLARRLSSELDEYSVSVDTTADRLATYQAVANTYLSTFQTLGSLGLLLGTVGLAVVLIRTVIERKAELALLASLGFRPTDRVQLIMSENAALLLLGLFVGAVCALIGVAPALYKARQAVNLTGLVLTLAAVVIVGIASSAVAVLLSGLHVTPADLRRE